MCRPSFRWIDPHNLTSDELERRYLNTYQTSLIPLCRNNSRGILKLCSDFKPALTNDGICFTRNGGQTDTVFKSTPYMEMFKRSFIPGRDKDPVLNNRGSGPQFQFSFLIDGDRTMDLKKGVDWNSTEALTYNLAIHPTKNMADVQQIFDVTSTQILAGYRTIIKVKGIDFVSEQQIDDIDISKRKCKFEDENEELRVFKWYSRYVTV